jgi:hypothetical protein
MGIAFFGTASLGNLPWLRWIALGWWVGELAIFALRHQPEALPLAALLMLVLLAAPGVVLLQARARSRA